MFSSASQSAPPSVPSSGAEHCFDTFGHSIFRKGRGIPVTCASTPGPDVTVGRVTRTPGGDSESF